MAAAISSSDMTIESSTSVFSSGHMVGSTDLPPAPSTNDGCQASKWLGLAALSATVASGAAVSGSAA